MSFRLYDYESNNTGNVSNNQSEGRNGGTNNNNMSVLLSQALASRSSSSSGMEVPSSSRGVARVLSAAGGGEESMRAGLNTEEELLLRSRLLAQAQQGGPGSLLAASTASASDNNSALQALLRLRANQQSAGLFGASGGQAATTNATAATTTSDNHKTALELELLYRWRANQMLHHQQHQQQQHPTLSTATNDLIEQALQLRNNSDGYNQATTSAGQRLSLLMQAGGSGLSLGGGGSGRLTSNEEAAAALLRRSLLERSPSISAAVNNGNSTELDIAALVRSSATAAHATHPDLAAALQRSFSGSGSHRTSTQPSSAAAYCQPALGRPSGGGPQPPQHNSGRPGPGQAPNNNTSQGDLLLEERKPKASNPILQLPPVEEGNTVHHSQRVVVPLGIEEDPNWLSERQCFIRSDLLEVVRASHEEVLVRSSSKSISYQQVGIRCRHCAHLAPGSRAIRASAFPSSIRQMYQSFTMMVRDHFGNCAGVPVEKKQHFLKLKGLTSPSSSLSRQYWTFAAQKLGMMDSEYGIMINEESQAAAAAIPPFGTSPEETAAIQAAPKEILVDEPDRPGISSYLFFLLQQAQIVHLLPSERVGKRKDAAVGLTGFGCRHCAEAGRLGFCRMFPLNKRSLPDKVNDLYNHMVRCPLCPRMTKRLLESRQAEAENDRAFAERDRDFIDRIWVKLGRDCDDAFKKS